MKGLPFLSLAWHNLRGGGQRLLVAGLCIAFGVMAVVSMSLLAGAIRQVLLIEARLNVGGDISLSRTDAEFLSPEDLTGLQALQEQGRLEAFTPLALNRYLALRLPDSGRLYFIPEGLGVDPAGYPVVGAMKVEGGDPAALLQNPGDILVTRDLADEIGLTVGQTLYLTDLSLGAPVEVTLRGVVLDNPNHQGGKVYYNYTTAQALRNSPLYLNRVLATTADPQAAAGLLEAQGWYTFTVNHQNDRSGEMDNMIGIGLNGAGVLGLLVGGIGIANTMQVLLRSRLQDAAVFKVLGYSQVDLQALFLAEALLLGAVGSLAGLGAGVGLSFWLVTLFNRISNLLVSWQFLPGPLVAGGLTGVATSMLFAWAAIASASRVHPAALLRGEQVRLPAMGCMRLALMAAGMLVFFIAIASLVMGSLLNGIGVVLFASASLLVFGGLFGGLVWLIARLLPVGGLPVLNMARHKLQRGGWGQVFGMIALFVGVTALGFAAVVTQSAKRELDVRNPELQGYNLILLGPATEEAALSQAAGHLPASNRTVGSETRVVAVAAEGEAPADSVAPVLIGRSLPHDYTLQGAAWGSVPDGVYTPYDANLPAGVEVRVTLPGGAVRSLTVVGSYQYIFGPASFRYQAGLLMPIELSRSLAPANALTYFIEMPVRELESATVALGAELPQATVINVADYIGRYMQTYRNLFTFAVAMAGLALLAGALLIADSVSLALIDRRFEMGVLKAVGYSQGHILAGLLFEYLFTSLLAIGFGLASVHAILLVIAYVNDVAAGILYLEPVTAVVITLGGAAMVLLTVLGVTWRPTQDSPLVVLNERG